MKKTHQPDNEELTKTIEGDAAVADEDAAPPEDPLAQAQRERDELKEQNLRLIAEGRNQAARFQREKAEALRYADADFARDLVLILDDLERTLESAKSAGDAGALVDGVRIVYEHFLKVLRDRNVEPIEAVGAEFDPTYHEALMKQPSDEPAGRVIQEVARGYKMHDRVLRPSRVIVSGGPATAEGE
jgi:molecular chaperone GrpE